MTCSRARINCSLAVKGDITEDDLKRLAVATARLSKAPLFISEAGGASIGQLRSRCRRMVQRHAIKLVVVDYLQLLRSGEKMRSRYEEVTALSGALKEIARELSIPMLVLAQLNRESERDDRKPRLSDLRDSGSIEQDADIVGLLHREDNEGQGPSNCQKVELIIAKHRNGPTGIVNLIFRKEFTRFESASRV